MRRIKKRLIMGAVMGFVFVASACSKTDNVTKKLQTEEVFYVLPGNLNYPIEIGCWQHADLCEIISSKPLDKSHFELKIEAPVSYETYLNEVKEEKEIEEFVYNCYRGADWKTMKKMAEAGKKDFVAKDERIAESFADYQDFEKQSDLYHYTVRAAFNPANCSTIVSISDAVIVYNNEEYPISFGEIDIKNEEIKCGGIEECVWELNSGACDADQFPNEEGLIELPLCDFHAERDIVIKEIYTPCENIEITDVSFSCVDDEKALDFSGKENVSVPAGSDISLSIKVKDKETAGVFQYKGQVIIYADVVCNNMNGTLGWAIQYGTEHTATEIYAQYIDKVDVLSYYIDYYSKLN